MLRKLLIAVAVLTVCLFGVASAASAAEQYPPSGEGSTPVTRPVRTSSPSSAAKAPKAAKPAKAKAPLARTGSDLVVLGGVALVLTAGGAVAVMASRRGLEPEEA